MKKILHIENSSWNVYNFRYPHIRKLKSRGYEVVVVSPIDEYFGYLNERHFSRHIPIKHLQPQGKNPLKDIFFFWELLKIYRQERPGLVVHFTIKPNLYGSLAARIAGIPAICVFTGLGYTFLHSKGIFRWMPWLCRQAFKKLKKLVVYNQEDKALVISKNLVPANRCEILRGSGVNTNHFRPLSPTGSKEGFVFLFIGRLMFDKGIAEVVKAVQALHEMGKSVECWVVGDFTYTNPSAVSRPQLMEWVAQRSIRYFGSTDDVRQFIRNTDVMVLPSHGGEGIPRVLLEAMAMGKPILSSTAPGCSDTVVHGRNGLLVPPKNAAALLEAMLHLIELPAQDLQKMGEESRKMAIARFDEKIITSKFLEIIEEVVKHKKHPAPAHSKAFF